MYGATHMKNAHSSWVGCHWKKEDYRYRESEIKNLLTCNSLMAPGSTVTSVAAMDFATLKVVESATLIVPPGT